MVATSSIYTIVGSIFRLSMAIGIIQFAFFSFITHKIVRAKTGFLIFAYCAFAIAPEQRSLSSGPTNRIARTSASNFLDRVLLSQPLPALSPAGWRMKNSRSSSHPARKHFHCSRLNLPRASALLK